MASKEKLINEAQFALGNASPGSADEQKYRRRASRLARYLLLRHAGTVEAAQAQTILQQLGEQGYDAPKKTITHSHRPSSAQPVNVEHNPAAHRRRPKQTGTMTSTAADDSWAGLWVKFSGLSQARKQTISFILMFIGLVLFFTPFLFLILLYYVFNRDALRKHLHALVNLFT